MYILKSESLEINQMVLLFWFDFLFLYFKMLVSTVDVKISKFLMKIQLPSIKNVKLKSRFEKQI